ncbi:MAG: VapC toxin family PIN domain ribonuclease [Verrucomicrobia bacterium]|nr:VapC toxin family PIN domain ribonuclease [Verrucomicrobiota bacterium]
MDIVIDTSTLIAVIVGEPERQAIIEATSGHTLIGPGSIPWEVGNAFSAMLKQKRIRVENARRAMELFSSIPLRYVEVDLPNAVSIAHQTNSYAYDAYFLDCALRHSAPLLTLDGALRAAATHMGVTLMEV